MDPTAVRVADSSQPTLATQLIAAIAAYVGSSDFAIDSLESPMQHSAPVIEFALSGLPRRIVRRGFGEVLFNENTALTQRGGCDGAMVIVLRFNDMHAVIDAERGHAEFEDDYDAYLIGTGHIFRHAEQARTLAAQRALERRLRTCREMLHQAIGMALPLPAHVVAKAMRDALASAIAPERLPWAHEVRYFFDRPDVEVMR